MNEDTPPPQPSAEPGCWTHWTKADFMILMLQGVCGPTRTCREELFEDQDLSGSWIWRRVVVLVLKVWFSDRLIHCRYCLPGSGVSKC